MQALAQIIAPSAGILIRDASSYYGVYYVALTLTVICFAIALSVKSFYANPKKDKLKKFSINSIISVSGIPFALTSVVCGFLLHIVTSYVDPFAKLTGHTAGISLFFTIYAVEMLLRASPSQA